MPVTKTLRECYEIRDGRPGGEWANITLHCWDRRANVGTPHEGTYYCGEITIQSSFGTWGYIWTACADPFKEFLQQVEFDYAFGKFMGSKLDEFDGDGSMRAMRERIIEHRKHDWLSKADARALWDELEDRESEATCSGNDWVRALQDAAASLRLDPKPDAAEFLSEPWEYIQTRPKPCAVNFWRTLWPEFIGALKRETGARDE
jgi:hypothetical protein